jgi:Lon protease-like protein
LSFEAIETMSQHEDDLAFEPRQFSGRARLFPLPNLVLFPHVVQPLHVFEPRYIELLEDALSGDRLITMALLKPGWEQNYEGRPPVAPIACLGRILSWQEQDGGRYNLLLLGLRRVRLARELSPKRSFREAIVDVLEDEYLTDDANHRQVLQRRLVRAFEKILPRMKDAHDLFSQLSMSNVSLGTLCDVIAYALDLDVQAKQALLAQVNVARRAEMLTDHLERSVQDPVEACATGFPPAFSAN